MLCDGLSSTGVKRRIEWHSILQHAVADVQQFSHGSADDDLLVSIGESISEGVDGCVVSVGSDCRDGKRPPVPKISCFRKMRGRWPELLNS